LLLSFRLHLRNVQFGITQRVPFEKVKNNIFSVWWQIWLRTEQ